MNNTVEILDPQQGEKEWLTKTEAAELTGFSVRKLERYSTRQELSKQVIDRAVHYSRKELLELVEVEKQRAEVPVMVQSQLHKPQALLPVAVDAQQAVQSLVDALKEMVVSSLPLPNKLTLTLKEASQLSGLTQKKLQEALEAGTLTIIRDGRRKRISRKQLEEWVETLSS